MALPRADIREARREARKPPRAPTLANQVPGASWGSTMSPTGQVLPGQGPVGGASIIGAGQTEGTAPTGGYSTAPGAGTGQSLAAQGSQFGQQAAMDALNQIRGYTDPTLTGAERGYMNAAIQRGTAQSQAAIQSLAQQAAARGAMDSGGLWAAQGAAAQGGANQAMQIGADMGMGAQQRALGATQALYGMGQGIDAAASGRGGAQDALNLSLANLGISTQQQDYQNALARWQALEEQRANRMSAITGGLQSLGSFGLGAASLARQG